MPFKWTEDSGRIDPPMTSTRHPAAVALLSSLVQGAYPHSLKQHGPLIPPHRVGYEM